jgi:hypothetical protein
MGFDDVRMELVEELVCESITTLYQREQWYIDNHPCCNNRNAIGHDAKEYMKTYRQIHQEQARAYDKAHYQDHKEQKKAYRKAHYQDHKEQNKEYTKANRERKNELQRIRRTKLKQAESTTSLHR